MSMPPPSEALARDFVHFAVRCGVLRFGEFKTKAGRLSPYFFNAGLFDDGAKLGQLAQSSRSLTAPSSSGASRRAHLRLRMTNSNRSSSIWCRLKISCPWSRIARGTL